MSFSAHIDDTKFRAMLEEMSVSVSAKAVRDVIDSETERVLHKAATLTKLASASKIADVKMRKYATLPSGKLVNPNWRLSNSDWRALQKRRREIIAEKKRRRGLAQQGFLRIGENLNIPVSTKSIATARKATVNSARPKQNVSGIRRDKGKGQISNVLTYRNPVGQYANATRALQSAINGRVQFFEKNVSMGVFDKASRIAKKYPGIKITP